MARPTSRVSRVVMTGPLAPFAEVYRAELRAKPGRYRPPDALLAFLEAL